MADDRELIREFVMLAYYFGKLLLFLKVNYIWRFCFGRAPRFSMKKKASINININLSHNAVNVSFGHKSGKGKNRSLAKMIFWRILLPIIISRGGLVFEGKYFTHTHPNMLC